MSAKNKFIPLIQAVLLKDTAKFVRILPSDNCNLLEDLEGIKGIEIVGDARFAVNILENYAEQLQQITVLKTPRGYFPEAAFNFRNLEELYLWNQAAIHYGEVVRMDDFCQVPDRFHLLPQLKILKGIWLDKNERFPESLFTCKKLTELVLGTENGVVIPNKFQEFPELEQLSITIQGKTDSKMVEKVLLNLTACDRLHYFRLKISDYFPNQKLTIPVQFSQLKQLKTLILNGTQICLPDKLNVETLEYYEIRSDEEKKLPWDEHSIPKNLHSLLVNGAKKLSSLNEIYANCPKNIRHLRLRDCGLHEVPKTIYFYPNLSHLDLSVNNIERTSATLWLLPNLQYVNLENNGFAYRHKTKKLLQFAKNVAEKGFSKYACLLQVAIRIKETAFYHFFSDETAVLLESLNAPQTEIAEKVLEIFSKNKVDPFEYSTIKHGKIYTQGIIYGYRKGEIEEKLIGSGLQLTDNADDATHVLLGIQPKVLPQAILDDKLELIPIEALKSYLAETSGSYISDKPENYNNIANLEQLFTSKDTVNVEMVLSILWEEGIPDALFFRLLVMALKNISGHSNWAARIIKKHAPIRYTHVLENLLEYWKIAHIETLPKEEQRKLIKEMLTQETHFRYKHYFKQILNKAKGLGL